MALATPPLPPTECSIKSLTASFACRFTSPVLSSSCNSLCSLPILPFSRFQIKSLLCSYLVALSYSQLRWASNHPVQLEDPRKTMQPRTMPSLHRFFPFALPFPSRTPDPPLPALPPFSSLGRLPPFSFPLTEGPLPALTECERLGEGSLCPRGSALGPWPGSPTVPWKRTPDPGRAAGRNPGTPPSARFAQYGEREAVDPP